MNSLIPPSAIDRIVSRLVFYKAEFPLKKWKLKTQIFEVRNTQRDLNLLIIVLWPISLTIIADKAPNLIGQKTKIIDDPWAQLAKHHTTLSALNTYLQLPIFF